MPRLQLAPANISELAMLPELTQHLTGQLVGGRNYWSPKATQELAEQRVEPLAPYRDATHDPHPRRSSLLSRIRYRIDTVFEQLEERYHVKREWARDMWHWCPWCSRLLREVLSHSLCLLLHQLDGNEPLQLVELVVS